MIYVFFMHIKHDGFTIEKNEQIATLSKPRCPLQLIELAAERGLQSHELCQDDRTVSSTASGGQRQPIRSLG